jgi:hypothetical protein
MDNATLIQQVNKELAIELAEKISMQDLHLQLSQYINYLIVNNFEKLVSLLYRIDVSEKKLTALLQKPQQAQAGNIIATLIIERQIEKIEARKKYNNDSTTDTTEEKW